MGGATGTIAVTGANGFVGRALVETARQRGISVRPLVRCDDGSIPGAVAVSNLSTAPALEAALARVDILLHFAARAHVTNERGNAPELYRQANVVASTRVAEASAAAGVKRIVFLSSVKVNGESTPRERPFLPTDLPCPQGPYGETKAMAEAALRDLAGQSGIDLAIVRSPLVYGPGARANMAALVSAVARGIPLPLAGIDNRRSLVGLGNLVDLLLNVAAASGTSDHAYFASDFDDVSSPELVRRIASAMGRPARMFAVPAFALEAVSALPKVGPMVTRLTESLAVDASATALDFAWTPPFTMQQQLAEML